MDAHPEQARRHTSWVPNYRQNARTDKVDGSVWWDGLVFDGWEPATRPQ